VALSVPTPQELKALRLKLGLTQAELAREAGVSQPLIARIENETVDPRASTLRAIVQALNRAERKEILIRDVMTAPVVVVKATDSVHDAIRIMRENNFSQVPVVAKGVPVGSVSERQIVHALSEARDGEAVGRRAVREIMGPPLPTAAPDTSIEQAYPLLEDQPALLVMERGHLVGLVAKSDLLRLV
jgi:predicted transcriptional regulator